MSTTKMHIDDILAKYFPSEERSISAGGNGVNNTTRFVETRSRKYVLRIYETHRDESKVEYEHQVLKALQEVQSPLRTPRPVQTMEGNTIVRTREGKLAALFHHIEGANPIFGKAVELSGFGWAAGQLTQALEEVHVASAPAYRPYYEIEHAHPRCPLSYVIGFCSKPPEEFQRNSCSLARIGEHLAVVKGSIERLKELPHQLVHGDLNLSNILADSAGRIGAILDFEFVTRDLRVMELAVCLSDLMHSSEEEEVIWERVGCFLKGYGSVKKLTPGEIDAIPLLILLRRLDVFIHFLGRYLDGVNSMDIVEDQIIKTDRQAHWISTNRERLLNLCESCIQFA